MPFWTTHFQKTNLFAFTKHMLNLYFQPSIHLPPPIFYLLLFLSVFYTVSLWVTIMLWLVGVRRRPHLWSVCFWQIEDFRQRGRRERKGLVYLTLKLGSLRGRVASSRMALELGNCRLDMRDSLGQPFEPSACKWKWTNSRVKWIHQPRSNISRYAVVSLSFSSPHSGSKAWSQLNLWIIPLAAFWGGCSHLGLINQIGFNWLFGPFFSRSFRQDALQPCNQHTPTKQYWYFLA